MSAIQISQVSTGNPICPHHVEYRHPAKCFASAVYVDRGTIEPKLFAMLQCTSVLHSLFKAGNCEFHTLILL